MAEAIPNPHDAGSQRPTPPPVSKTTRLMTGLLVDIYGLDELPPPPPSSSSTGAAPVETDNDDGSLRLSVLWLHHARGSARGDMHDAAAWVLSGWNRQQKQGRAAATASRRGMIAVAFDQRNHGHRAVHADHVAAAGAGEGGGGGGAGRGGVDGAVKAVNTTWRAGNETHAQDMLGVISGAVEDTGLLMDALMGYLGPELEGGGWREVRVDQHLVLGVSLGGHSAWQLMMAEKRVTAGVIIVGCPDFMSE